MNKVIVVDDIKSYCEAVCERLRGMGIEAVGCYNVKKAKWLIEHASRNDVMLVDLMRQSGRGGCKRHHAAGVQGLHLRG